MNTGQIGALNAEFARSAAGGDHQFFVGDGVTVGGGDGFAAGVDLRHPGTGAQVNVSVDIKFFWSNKYPLQGQFSREVLLRQRWALVGWKGLVAQDDDLTLVTFLPKTRRSLSSPLTCSYNDHRRHKYSVKSLIGAVFYTMRQDYGYHFNYENTFVVTL